MGYPFDCAILRDLVPRLLFFDLQSADFARQVRGCRGIQYRAARLGCTCSTAIYDLQSADFLCFIIRNRRYSFDLLSGFTRGEYHVIRVDFIVALRRTKGRGRRTLRSPSPPSSGLHLLTPGYPLRRGISAAAADRDIVSLFPVQVDHRHFDVSFGCFVFGLGLFAFQKITLGIESFVFHYWGEGRLFLRLR